MKTLRTAPFRRRAVSALLVGLWCWGSLGALFHGARDVHRYCAEHGAFEEVASAATQVATSSTGSAGSGSRAFSSESRDPGHEICAFAELGERTLAGSDSACFGALLPAVPPRVELAPAIVALPIPLLALAPKASPPVRSV